MVAQSDLMAHYNIVPPGYELAQKALIQFHNDRVDASNVAERDVQRTQSTMLVTNALCAGTLVVFIRTMEGDMVPVPRDAWGAYPPNPNRPHANVSKLHNTGLRHDDPLVLVHDTFAARGLALFDQHNWTGFFTYAGRWPTYKIPASVKMLLNFCECKDAYSAKAPLQVIDAVYWIKRFWPLELEDLWSRDAREKNNSTEAREYPPIVQALARVALESHERKGGNLPQKYEVAVNHRRARINHVDLENDVLLESLTDPSNQ